MFVLGLLLILNVHTVSYLQTGWEFTLLLWIQFTLSFGQDCLISDVKRILSCSVFGNEHCIDIGSFPEFYTEGGIVDVDDFRVRHGMYNRFNRPKFIIFDIVIMFPLLNLNLK